MLISEVAEIINSYGYRTIKSSDKKPSFYKLKDGTIIEAIINIGSIIEDKSNPDEIFIRTSNNAKAYVPKEQRNQDLFVDYQQTDLSTGISEDEDIDYEEQSIRNLFSRLSLKCLPTAPISLFRPFLLDKCFDSYLAYLFAISLS